MSQTYTPRFPRHPQEIPLNAAELELFRNLEFIAQKNRQADDLGRKAATESLQFVLTYLDKRGLSGQAMVGLIRIRDAFTDLEAKTQPELFDVLEPRKNGSKGSRKWTRSLAGQDVKYYSTACLGALMASGMLENEAAAKVARHAQSWPRFSEGIIQASTVANWRDEILQLPDGAFKKRQYLELLSHFVRDGKPTPYLQEVLDDGPPLTFGRRKTKT